MYYILSEVVFSLLFIDMELFSTILVIVEKFLNEIFCILGNPSGYRNIYPVLEVDGSKFVLPNPAVILILQLSNKLSDKGSFVLVTEQALILI